MKHKEYRKLHAEWYALCSAGDQSKEVDFLAQKIDAKEPVLELGSGTGRILIPLLERGFHVVGIDTSEDMMEQCRIACKAKGLQAELHEQSMVNFELPQQFGTILLVSGSLGLFIADQDIHAMFQCVMAHLKPGGLFLCEFEQIPAEYDDSHDSRWYGDWERGADNVVMAQRVRRKYDTSSHVWEQLYVIEKFVNGRLIETEANERWGRFFSVDEAMHYAKTAGFTDIKITKWMTEGPPNQDSHVVTIQCKKSVA